MVTLIMEAMAIALKWSMTMIESIKEIQNMTQVFMRMLMMLESVSPWNFNDYDMRLRL